jgi:hypothetical protein
LFTLPLLGIIFPFISNRNLQVDIMMWALLLVPLYYFTRTYLKISFFQNLFKEKDSKIINNNLKNSKVVFSKNKKTIESKQKPTNELYVAFIHSVVLFFVLSVFIVLIGLIYLEFYLSKIWTLAVENLPPLPILDIVYLVVNFFTIFIFSFFGFYGIELFVLSWLLIIIFLLLLVLSFKSATKFINKKYYILNRNKIALYSAVFFYIFLILLNLTMLLKFFNDVSLSKCISIFIFNLPIIPLLYFANRKYIKNTKLNLPLEKPLEQNHNF